MAAPAYEQTFCAGHTVHGLPRPFPDSSLFRVFNECRKCLGSGCDTLVCGDLGRNYERNVSGNYAVFFVVAGISTAEGFARDSALRSMSKRSTRSAFCLLKARTWRAFGRYTHSLF